jgi:hypothetical protein
MRLLIPFTPFPSLAALIGSYLGLFVPPWACRTPTNMLKLDSVSGCSLPSAFSLAYSAHRRSNILGLIVLPRFSSTNTNVPIIVSASGCSFITSIPELSILSIYLGPSMLMMLPIRLVRLVREPYPY